MIEREIHVHRPGTAVAAALCGEWLGTGVSLPVARREWVRQQLGRTVTCVECCGKVRELMAAEVHA